MQARNRRILSKTITLIESSRPDHQELARKIVDEGLSVRQVEKLAAQTSAGVPLMQSPAKPAKDADTEALERRLSDALGLKVKINHRDSGRGRVTIDYKSLEQLDALERKLID